jgi:ribosomal protein L16/L10AE
MSEISNALLKNSPVKKSCKSDRMLSMLGNCPYRVGIVKRGKVMFRCIYAHEEYDISEMLTICTDFCPFTLRRVL